MFRGYNLKNKKWLYGYYLVNRGKHFIAEEGLQPPGMTWEDFEVDPESVGQFTDMISREGDEIYEGDILQMEPGIISPNPINKVVWRTDLGMFGFIPKDYLMYQDPYLGNYKVIGNEYELKIDSQL
jgi:hypothetical protein